MFPEILNEEKNINPNSKNIINAFAESSLLNTNIGNHYQFERLGFYVTDKDTTNEKIVFNRIVDLKESKFK